VVPIFGITSVISRAGSVIGYISRGLRSGIVMSTVILVVLAGMIWFYGPAFRYLEYAPLQPVANRVIVIGILVILWGINNYFLARAAVSKKSKKQVESEVKPYDPVDELIGILKTSFRSTMKLICDKWMGKDQGYRTLYAMPWYLVIGPSESGKTSLIVDADLNFPLGHELRQDHSNPTIANELPQYWITRESVLFDIPGTWLDNKASLSIDLSGRDDIDSERPVAKISGKETRKKLWQAFTDLLNEFRPRRPINGVIITFDMVELIQMSNEKRTAVAMDIHARLVEIAERLGTRFTVYVVMTKLDRLAGFREYYAQMPKTDRQQPFGFSFPVYSEIDTDKWIEDFEKGFSSHIRQCNDDLIDLVNNQRETEIRRNIYIFLRELAATGPIIGDFFRRALLSDRFSTPPLVRGIYFTSALQEGVPFNALLTKISDDYHMTQPVMPAYSGHSTQYFTKKLFTDVIFKEAGLAGDNQKVENHKRLVLRSSILTSILSVLGLVFILTETMMDNTGRADNVLKASKDFIDLPRDLGIENGETQFLAALNAISTANNVFPDWHTKSEMRRYAALYQGRRIGPEVQEAYEGLLRDKFLPSISYQIKSEIDRLGASRETYNSDERLDALRVYLLLGDIKRRQELDAFRDTMSLGKIAVMAWIQKNWQKRFEGQKNVQADLAKHLEYALSTNRIVSPIDKKTVAETQRALREVPRDVRLYRNLKALAARQVPGGISLRNTIGPSFDIVFRHAGENADNNADIVVPYFFTKRGFQDFFVPKSKDVSIIAVEDAWVTGERERIRYSDEDLQAFLQKLRHSYATDYINFWNSAIGNLNIVQFRNIDDATRVFSEINGPANPFGRLLGLVKSETEIYDAAPAKTDENQPKTEIAFDRNREYGLRIARAFSELSALIMAKEGQTQPLEELMKTTANMELYFKSIQTGQQSSKPVALEKAQGRAKLQGDDPIFVLRRNGSSLPKPFDSYFQQLADNSWKVILDAAKVDLQAVWQASVYRTFNVDLAGRYPFNIASREEVSLQEFQRFFGVDGEFDRFFNDCLKTFVNVNTGQPILIDGQSLRVSDEFIKQVTRVRSVRDIFFNADGVPTLRYTVEPVSMSGNISRSVLNIEGQLIPYSHGPSRPISILWPNALSSKQDISQISTSKSGGSGSLTYTGLWSSFRLFDQSEIDTVTPESAELVFSVADGQIKYRVRMSATEKNPFVLRPLTQLKLPEQL